MLLRAQTPSLPFRILGFLLLIPLLHACSSRMPETVAPPPATMRVVPGEEPEPSPLAQLMREMTAFTDSTGKHLVAGKDLLPYPEQFKALPTAEPTPGMAGRRTFDPYARAWLHQLDSLYTTPTTDRSEVFNALVQTCAACHGTMCPGPLSRIKKLSIPDVVK